MCGECVKLLVALSRLMGKWFRCVQQITRGGASPVSQLMVFLCQQPVVGVHSWHWQVFDEVLGTMDHLSVHVNVHSWTLLSS